MKTPQKPQHTPTPWYSEVDTELVYILGTVNGKEEVICEAGSIGNEDLQAQANAAHIVKCVNLHDELVDAVEHLLKMSNGEKNLDNRGIEELLSRARATP